MKILFIYPENESLGIEILSAVLKKHGHQTSLALDPKLFSDAELKIKFLARRFKFIPRVLDKIKKYQPDLIAFSVVTDEYAWACKVAQAVKSYFKIPIVFGGIHPTAVPDRVLKNDFVDFVIRGEGEYALLELVENLNKPAAWLNIKNLSYKLKGQIFQNEVRCLIENLSQLPQPDKKLFFKQMPYAQDRYLITTSRGCPNVCTYCCNSLLFNLYKGKGKYVRRRDVDDVIQELSQAKKQHPLKEIIFYDDHFIFNQDWLKEFLEKYKKKIGIPFRCLAIAKYFNQNTVDLLKESGLCDFVQIGIQSASDRLRREICHRYDDNQKIAQVIKQLKQARISVTIDHIFGFPTETIEDQIESAKFYNKIKPNFIDTYWLTYYPGSQIVNIAKQHGLISQQDIENIEEGRFQSRVEPTKNIFYNQAYQKYTTGFKQIKKFQVLFNLISIFPQKINNYIINHQLYKFLPASNFFGVTLHKILLLFYVKTYRYKAVQKLNKYIYQLF